MTGPCPFAPSGRTRVNHCVGRAGRIEHTRIDAAPVAARPRRRRVMLAKVRRTYTDAVHSVARTTSNPAARSARRLFDLVVVEEVIVERAVFLSGVPDLQPDQDGLIDRGIVE